jgi:hypothetical protein
MVNKEKNNILDKQQRIDLAALIKANECDDCTKEIRSKKQSILISNDVKHMVFLKQKHENMRKADNDGFDALCVKECSFLFNNYTDLYNKIINDKIDLSILERFLAILKKIEDGEIDQHEGSYLVGSYLKEMYIDSALKSNKNADSNANANSNTEHETSHTNNEKKISYKDFKMSKC